MSMMQKIDQELMSSLVEQDNVKDLEKKLGERETEIQLAASYGQMLLKENQKLTQKLESCTKEYETRELENSAEHSSLMRRLELLINRNKWLEGYCNDLKLENETISPKVQDIDVQEVQTKEKELSFKIEILEKELDVSRRNEKNAMEMLSCMKSSKVVDRAQNIQMEHLDTSQNDKIQEVQRDNELLRVALKQSKQQNKKFERELKKMIKELQVCQQQEQSLLFERDALQKTNQEYSTRLVELKSKCSSFEMGFRELTSFSNAIKASPNPIRNSLFSNELLLKAKMKNQQHSPSSSVISPLGQSISPSKSTNKSKTFSTKTFLESNNAIVNSVMLEMLEMLEMKSKTTTEKVVEKSRKKKRTEEKEISKQNEMTNIPQSPPRISPPRISPPRISPPQSPPRISPPQSPSSSHDVLRDFFYLTTVCAAINHRAFESCNRIEKEKLYQEAIEKKIPFFQWYDWISDRWRCPSCESLAKVKAIHMKKNLKSSTSNDVLVSPLEPPQLGKSYFRFLGTIEIQLKPSDAHTILPFERTNEGYFFLKGLPHINSMKNNFKLARFPFILPSKIPSMGEQLNTLVHSGLVENGDRIISINEQYVAGCTQKDVEKMLFAQQPSMPIAMKLERYHEFCINKNP